MIQLFKNYGYDSVYEKIKCFDTKAAQDTYFNAHAKEDINNTNYIRENTQEIKVALDYDYMLTQGFNYLRYDNGYGKYMYAFILQKEIASKGVTKLSIQLDVIQTFMFDFTFDKSFVMRKSCPLSEVVDYDEGINIGEHHIESETIVANKEYTEILVLDGIAHRDDVNNELYNVSPMNMPITKIDGIDYPLVMIDTTNLTDEAIKLIEASHNCMGIYSFPKCYPNTTSRKIPVYSLDESTSAIATTWIFVDVIHRIDIGGSFTANPVPVAKNEITDYYPYTYYVMTDGENTPLVLYTRYLTNNFTVSNLTALGLESEVKYFVEGYKGDAVGKTYCMVDDNILVTPSRATDFANLVNSRYSATMQKRVNMRNSLIRNTALGLGTLASGAVTLATGGSGAITTPMIIGGALASANWLNSAIGGNEKIKEYDAQLKDVVDMPSSMVNKGSRHTRDNYFTDNVRVQKWTINNTHKQKVRDYVAKYGYKYNRFDTIDHKTYKGYLQFTNLYMTCGLDGVHKTMIKQIFERGVIIE